jgi:hypothetical protein
MRVLVSGGVQAREQLCHAETPDHGPERRGELAITVGDHADVGRQHLLNPLGHPSLA